MKTAQIKRGITANIEVIVLVDDIPVANIRCNDYGVKDNMIICKQRDYNSYVWVQDYTVTTWKIIDDVKPYRHKCVSCGHYIIYGRNPSDPCWHCGKRCL